MEKNKSLIGHLSFIGIEILILVATVFVASRVSKGVSPDVALGEGETLSFEFAPGQEDILKRLGGVSFFCATCEEPELYGKNHRVAIDIQGASAGRRYDVPLLKGTFRYRMDFNYVGDLPREKRIIPAFSWMKLGKKDVRIDKATKMYDEHYKTPMMIVSPSYFLNGNGMYCLLICLGCLVVIIPLMYWMYRRMRK